MNRVKLLFEGFSFGSEYSLLDTSKENDELKKIAEKRGIVVPSKDLAILKIKYAMVDKENKNKCTLPRAEVVKALKTLTGKAVDKDHLRQKTLGTFLDAELDGDTMIAYASFWKSNFPEEFEEITNKMKEGKVKVSFEAWGDRIVKANGSYDLTDIEFAGGALLFDTKPAFPEAEVLSMGKQLEFAKIIEGEINDRKETETLQIEEAKLDFNYDSENIARVVYNYDCKNCKVKGYQEVKSIDFENNKIKHKCISCGEVCETDMTPQTVIVKKGKSIKKPSTAKLDGGKEMEEKIKQLEQELAALKTQMEEKVKELASKTEELEKAKTTLETLKKESEEAKVKIETMEKEVASKIEDAKKEATTVAERRAELAEFAKDVKDEVLLNEASYENLKLKKQLSEKETEIAELKKNTPEKKPVMAKGSKDKSIPKVSSVQDMAWGKNSIESEEEDTEE